MKLIALIRGLFSRRKNRSSLISEALSEGIKDTFKEMGYRFDENDKQNK